jgi:hypothetical protein
LTYPQQYGQPQQGYPYPAPQQLPPNPSAFPAGAAPQFVNPGETPAPAPAPSLGFQDPSGGGGASPAARHLEGRTIIIRPRRVDENSSYQGQSRPTAYLDLYVIDGGPLVFGDSEDRANPRPPTHRVETPAYFENVMIGNTAFVSEVRSKLGPDGRPTGLALGVVQRGTRGQRPYMITTCAKDLDGNVRPDGEQRKALAQQVYQAHEQGAWQPPKAVPLAAAVQQQPYAQVNYAQAATPQQAAAMASQHLDQMVNAQYGPPQQAAWPAPAAAPGLPPAPGWDPMQWGQFTPEQQQAIWAQASASATPASAPPVTGPAVPPAAPATPPQAQQGGPGW